MDSRFASLRQRDTSVSMLRVKMSRRRSQSQKENREKTVNMRRQLDKVAELEMSTLDASMAVTNMSTIQEKTINKANAAKDKAVEERLKQLKNWKERKALQKEKEKRERERKGIFKTGLYHPKDTKMLIPLPPVQASTRAKETKVNIAPSQSGRVTRSMKQQAQQPQKEPLKAKNPNVATKRAPPAVQRSTRSRAALDKSATTLTQISVCAVVPVVRALSTRSTSKAPSVAAPVGKQKTKETAADVRTTRNRANVNSVPPSFDRGRNCQGAAIVEPVVCPAAPEAPEPTKADEPCPPSSCSEEERVEVDETPADADVGPPTASSFAPEGFVFQAPVGLSSFKFEPMTPRSVDAFLTPSFNLAPVHLLNFESARSEPSPQSSPPRLCPAVAAPLPESPREAKHDVPYFRKEIATETERLTSLCAQWESRVEDESIPEEMRDRMRTAVGQARLLMKERFKQFSGLVDDCELQRGEKITTCSDLQGFWDMVYFQVEDVNKKFGALKEAEARGWVEEDKRPQRQKKVVKKPAAGPAKPTGGKAAAKSRLAAVKAAMKAMQLAAEAERAAKAAEDEPGPGVEEPQALTQAPQTGAVVFDGGFFQVESPAKAPAPLRRSSRLSAAVLPKASPCSKYLSPRGVTRRSLAQAATPVQTLPFPAQPTHTPAHLRLAFSQTPGKAPKSQHGTPQPERGEEVENMCFSPVAEVLSDSDRPRGTPAQHTEQLTADSATSESETPLRSRPSVSVVRAEDPAAFESDLTHSPCKLSAAAEPTSGFSFTLSPCGTPCQPPFSSPAMQTQPESPNSMCCTPDGAAVEEIPGLDFERYLQPSQRSSLSPKGNVAMEMLSPMEVDAEMESPRGQAQQDTALPAVSSVLAQHSSQTETAESSLFLFTPNPKDRIRQSVCPSDLMVFTPPF